MKQTRSCVVYGGALIVFLSLQPSLIQAQALRSIDCDAGDTLEGVDNYLRSGNTLMVSGTCNEHVVITQSGITLDGQGTATISSPDANTPTLVVRGAQRVTIKGFTITGGSTGIFIGDGAMADVDDCVVQNNDNGILTTRNSTLRLINSTIQNNTTEGVTVTESSVGRIGLFNTDTLGPNTVTGNGADGIRIQRGSTARIEGNDINSNTGDGIQVRTNSTADISDNDIDSNADGVDVRWNSTVRLGDTGTANRTTTDNAGAGLRCFDHGVVWGLLGMLNGTADGATSLAGDCNNNLAP